MLLFQILIVSQGRGSFFAPTNITNLIAQNSYVVILATGMLLCILTGGNIDLSVGSIVALVGAMAGTLIVNLNVNIYLSILICLILGIAIGAWQGFWIAYMRIPAFIVTLAGMLTFRGLALILLNGLTISPFPKEYVQYFNSYFNVNSGSGIPVAFSLTIGAIACCVLIAVQVISRVKKERKHYAVEPFVFTLVKIVIICFVIMAACWLLGHDKGIPVILITLGVIVAVYQYYTSRTVSGRHLYAMGGNEKAAKFSGIDTNKVMFFAYTNMGFLSAVAALVCVARFNSAAPSAGNSYELDAIAACFIGGASAYGGVGTISGAVIGAIFMGVLNNGMSILGIDANWQRAVKGIVLLGAVIADVISQKRSRSS
ncbi:MAG: sugar ABC transporter permease [Clostridiales Family XIII bacterium]|nr:sugar ABC transporter permease [Clostridiales Family XIII bacterium]